MGREDKRYSVPLEKQAFEKLKTMRHFGESKKAAKADGSMRNKIFSYGTFKDYKREIEKFCNYVSANYPKCTTLDGARKYVVEWLDYRNSEGLSAWTVQLDAKAVGKLYGIIPGDEDYYEPPVRRRNDIKRSRFPAKRDQLFSEEKNRLFVDYCKATGQRRSEVEKARPEDLITRDEINDELRCLSSKPLSVETIGRMKILEDTRGFDEIYYMYTKGKGGRERLSPIIGINAEKIVSMIDELKGKQKYIWVNVPIYADIHSYRADYANAVYQKYAREIENIPFDKLKGGINQMYRSEIYYCRNDEKGKKLDRKAMKLASLALGHSRVQVVAENYLRGI